jgi:pilus assembly protein CpaD
MSRIKSFATAAVLGLGASACASSNSGPLSAVNNPSLYSVHQPVVERTDFVLDLSADRGGVSPAEIERLHGWFDSIGLRYGDRISVDEGYGAGGARADVARAVGEYGLQLEPGAPVTAGEVGAGAIRVIASRASASVPSCPNWDAAGNGITPPQGTSTNYGCSTNSNLAAMIANPNDLVRGQVNSGNGASSTASRAIRVYREGPPTGQRGLSASTTTGGSNQ